MRIEVRNDSVLLDGYVNATGKDSRFIPSIKGKFKEQIVPEAFTRSLEKNDNVDLLLNHDKNRKLGSTKEGNLELFEDGIGLRAICTVTDADVIEKAKNGQLRGWSFGFYSEKDKWEDTTEGFQRRYVEELDLFEVSIVDNTMTPAYVGTSIEMRSEEEIITETRSNDSKTVLVDKTEKKNEKENRTEEFDNSSYKEHQEFFELKHYK